MGRGPPARELGKRRRNSARCAPSPELKRPELRLRKGRTRPPSFICLRTAQPWVPAAVSKLGGRGGGLRMLFLVLLKVTQRGLTPPPPPLLSSLRFLLFRKRAFFLPQYLTCLCPPHAQQAPQPELSLQASHLHKKKPLAGRQPSSPCLRVWGGGGA